jgi:hypothetical protein
MKTSPTKSLKIGASKKRSHSEAEDAGQASPPPSTPRPNLTKEWKKAKLKIEDLLARVNSGFLWETDMDLWRAAPAIRIQARRTRTKSQCLPCSWSVD